MGCRFLLQGIFPTQGLNPGLLHCRQMLQPLSHQGNPHLFPTSGSSSESTVNSNLQFFQLSHCLALNHCFRHYLFQNHYLSALVIITNKTDRYLACVFSFFSNLICVRNLKSRHPISHLSSKNSRWDGSSPFAITEDSIQISKMKFVSTL